MNAPKLRFKEFNDEYKLININDILIEHNAGIYIEKSKYGTGTNIVGVSNLYNNTKIDGQIFRLAPLSEVEREKYILKENDIIYGESSLVPIGIAMTLATSKKGEGTAFEWHTRRFRIDNSKVNSFYLSYMLNFFYKTRNHLASVSTQTALTGITTKDFFNTKFNYPSIKEQEKVVKTLDLLDKKIELQSKKIEDLKLFKKGLSTTIFNSLRDFEEYKLGKICNITTGKLDANAMIDNGKYRFYTCAKEYSLIDKYAFDTEALLISGNGAYVGYIHYYKGKFNAYQRTYVLDNFSQNIQFIKCYLEENLAKRINSEKKEGNTPYIVLSTLSDMVIKIPSKENQIKISNIINCHNKKIELEENKLLKLQELKKGLMQSMFV